MNFKWLKTCAQKVITTARRLLYQKDTDAVKNVASKCEQFLYEHFASQENIQNEKIYKHFKETFGMVRAEYQHILQQLATAAETCLNKIQHLSNADEEQQASHVTAFDSLFEFLEETKERIQNTMEHINAFQALFTDGKSKMFNQDYSQNYSGQRTKNKMQHLEEDLQGIFSEMTIMMDILGEVDRLVYIQKELLQQQEPSEAKFALENRIKCLLNEVSLLAPS